MVDRFGDDDGFFKRSPVQAIFQDGFDACVACGLEVEGPCAGGLKSGIAMGFS